MLFEGIQLGQYHIRRLVGRGGTGDVYLADDQKLLRQVALKIVQIEDPTSEVAKEAARLFQREALMVAKLNHPNILPLFDFGETVVSGVTISYLVTPFCSEGSLTAWLRQRSGSLIVPPRDAFHIMRQAADALEYAHDQQIIHRDVKPSNFLVRSRKDTPSRPDLLLADFGVARLTQGNVNMSKTVRGTPTYMAPEQWSANPVSATDQYALAIMTYELLTGRPPFLGTQEQIMYQHLMVQPQPPSAFNTRIPSSVDAVVLHALAKQPADRYPSISAFASAFEHAVAEMPSSPRITVTPPPLSTPFHLTRNTPSIAASNISPPHLLASNLTVPQTATPGSMERNELYAVLPLSTAEALAGTERTVLIPGRQPIDISVPAGVHDGQVIRLQNRVDASLPNMPKKDLVLTITVTPPAGEVTSEPPDPASSRPSNPSISRPTRPSIPELAVIQAIPGLAPSRITWKTLSFVGLALLLLLVGVVALSPLGKTLSPINAPNATATANASNATMQAVQSGVSAATATANAQAMATAQAQATAAVNANLIDPTMQQLKLYEALNRASSSGWDTNGGCTFAADGYHVLAQTTTQLCIAHNLTLSDFTLQMQINILKGTGGGILFRSTGSAGYYFRITVDGHYALFTCNGADCSKALSSGFSSEITQGLKQTNSLAVVVTGNHIDLYVNGIRINGGNGSGSLQGQIGVVAESGSQVVFGDAKIWTM
ncbi:MAG TPA: protein kinase [Ktedonobacteraceae bacterium]|nr:protein kinase [Ktedonobacteraceae bacterium]